MVDGRTGLDHPDARSSCTSYGCSNQRDAEACGDVLPDLGRRGGFNRDPRRDAHSSAGGIKDGAQTTGCRQRDDVLLPCLVQAAQIQRRRADQHHRLLGQHIDLQTPRRRTLRGSDNHVETATLELLDQRGGQIGPHPDR